MNTCAIIFGCVELGSYADCTAIMRHSRFVYRVGKKAFFCFRGVSFDEYEEWIAMIRRVSFEFGVVFPEPEVLNSIFLSGKDFV